MGRTSGLRTRSKTVKTPRAPFQKERIDAELKLCGEFGLRCKREVWRVHYALTKIRKAAKELLMLEENDPKRIFEGTCLLNRLHNTGVLERSKDKLDYVLSLKEADMLNRRLQTIVFKNNLAKSIHHARVLIYQRHIRVGKQMVNIPSFIVRTDSEKQITFSATSSLAGTGRKGRVLRKKAKSAKADEE